jgi:FaeA-like protein.
MSNTQPRRDDDSKFTSDIPEQIIDEMLNDGEPVIASEIAKMVGVSKSSANYNLDKLHDEGKVKKAVS